MLVYAYIYHDGYLHATVKTILSLYIATYKKD